MSRAETVSGPSSTSGQGGAGFVNQRVATGLLGIKHWVRRYLKVDWHNEALEIYLNHSMSSPEATLLDRYSFDSIAEVLWIKQKDDGKRFRVLVSSLQVSEDSKGENKLLMFQCDDREIAKWWTEIIVEAVSAYRAKHNEDGRLIKLKHFSSSEFSSADAAKRQSISVSKHTISRGAISVEDESVSTAFIDLKTTDEPDVIPDDIGDLTLSRNQRRRLKKLFQGIGKLISLFSIQISH